MSINERDIYRARCTKIHGVKYHIISNLIIHKRSKLMSVIFTTYPLLSESCHSLKCHHRNLVSFILIKIVCFLIILFLFDWCDDTFIMKYNDQLEHRMIGFNLLDII